MRGEQSAKQVRVDFRMKAHHNRASGSHGRRAQISRGAQDGCLESLVSGCYGAHVELLHLLALASQDAPRSFENRSQTTGAEPFLPGIYHPTDGSTGALESGVGAFAARSAPAVIVEVDALGHAHILPFGIATPYAPPVIPLALVLGVSWRGNLHLN